jgi:hypothetical protein
MDSDQLAIANLTRCLEAMDQNGEEGLQRALDSIYPPAKLKRVRLSSYACGWVLADEI